MDNFLKIHFKNDQVLCVNMDNVRTVRYWPKQANQGFDDNIIITFVDGHEIIMQPTSLTDRCWSELKTEILK